MSNLKRSIAMGAAALVAGVSLAAMPAPSHADSTWKYRCADFSDTCGDRGPVPAP